MKHGQRIRNYKETLKERRAFAKFRKKNKQFGIPYAKNKTFGAFIAAGGVDFESTQ